MENEKTSLSKLFFCCFTRSVRIILKLYCTDKQLRLLTFDLDLGSVCIPWQYVRKSSCLPHVLGLSSCLRRDVQHWGCLQARPLGEMVKGSEPWDWWRRLFNCLRITTAETGGLQRDWTKLAIKHFYSTEVPICLWTLSILSRLLPSLFLLSFIFCISCACVWIPSAALYEEQTQLSFRKETKEIYSTPLRILNYTFRSGNIWANIIEQLPVECTAQVNEGGQ